MDRKIQLFAVTLALFVFTACAKDTAEPHVEAIPQKTAEKIIPAEKDENAGKLIISELMAKNQCTLLDSDGDFSDWIELENCSDEIICLDGWALSDDEGEKWILPDRELKPGERLIVFASGKDKKETELHTDFKLSSGETLSLLTPEMSISCAVVCSNEESDYSLMLSDGEYVPSLYPTPGYENTYAGYDLWQESLQAKGPIIISEVMVANHFRAYEDYINDSDWVIIKNISEDVVWLNEYCLSDDDDNYALWTFPEIKLSPGSSVSIICGNEKYSAHACTGFELNSTKEQLYLSKNGEIVDFALLRDIPANGSYGRMDGENGWFFFEKASYFGNNTDGMRRVTDSPVSFAKDGVYNGIENLEVELSGKGTIYYTTDGSLPNKKSCVYTEPVLIDKTCVLRAVAVEEGALPSRALTLNFIINENHSLPVASLCVDEPADFTSIYNGGYKGTELKGSFSLYEEDSSFTIGCGVNMTGQASLLTQPKKNMKLTFRGVYGDSVLDYDLFGQELKQFNSIVLRASQVYNREIFRQEVWQDLALEMSDSVLSQYSKYAVLYINGEYYGITCIKEDVSKSYYASHAGVSKESVESVKTPDMDLEVPDFKSEIYMYCAKNDLSIQENYEYIENRLDIDSFIDWMILQGVCGNQDLINNVRFFRSSEGSGKWQSVLFDLDKSMIEDYSEDFVLGETMPDDDFPFRGIMGNAIYLSRAIHPIVESLFENNEFKDKFLSRYAEVYDSVLSNERVLERIDYYAELLRPEIERNHARWNLEAEKWEEWVEHLRKAVIELDWQNYAKDSLCNYLELTNEEIEHYFG